MAKVDKLITKLLNDPADFTWNELVRLLGHFGYGELKTGKTGGSRRKFANKDKHIIDLHKPHPDQILKKYQIKDIIASLKETGKI